MPSYPNDALDAALCHGDLSIQLCANTPGVNIHALRDILKHLPGLLLMHWKQEGVVPPIPAAPRSDEHTSELPSLMSHSYPVFCWNIKTYTIPINIPAYIKYTTYHLNNTIQLHTTQK